MLNSDQTEVIFINPSHSLNFDKVRELLSLHIINLIKSNSVTCFDFEDEAMWGITNDEILS